jgi:hypothetical protein
VNPFELVAIGGDIGRAIDRETSKELIGYTITVRDESGQPLKSFSLGTDGGLVSVADWKNGDISGVTSGEDYLNSL